MESPGQAAVVEPLAGAAYALERGSVHPGDSVLVTGGGPVGLMVLLGLKALGRETFTSPKSPRCGGRKPRSWGRRRRDPLETKVSSWVKEVTSGRGVDVAVESMGVEASLKDCLASVRYKGRVIVQGIFTERVPVHMLGFVTRETTMIGTNSINPTLAMEWIEVEGDPARVHRDQDHLPLRHLHGRV